MNENWTLHVDDVGEVDLDMFVKGVRLAMDSREVSGNPIFQRGADVVLCGRYKAKPMWREGEHGMRKVLVSAVKLANYCGTCELLVIDAEGNHIIYNKIDGIPWHDLAEEYYREFELVKGLVNVECQKTFGDNGKRLAARYWKENMGVVPDVLK